MSRDGRGVEGELEGSLDNHVTTFLLTTAAFAYESHDICWELGQV